MVKQKTVKEKLKVPKIYKTKGKNPKLFIKVNGKKKYIKLSDPNMSDEQIVKYIQAYYRIKKGKPKKKAQVQDKQIRQDKKITSNVEQQPLRLPTIGPSGPIPISSGKQDIPEITNLLGELRTYKQIDQKRQEEIKQLEIAKKKYQADEQMAKLEAQRALAEKTRLERERDIIVGESNIHKSMASKRLKELEKLEARTKNAYDKLQIVNLKIETLLRENKEKAEKRYSEQYENAKNVLLRNYQHPNSAYKGQHSLKALITQLKNEGKIDKSIVIPASVDELLELLKPFYDMIAPPSDIENMIALEKQTRDEALEEYERFLEDKAKQESIALVDEGIGLRDDIEDAEIIARASQSDDEDIEDISSVPVYVPREVRKKQHEEGLIHTDTGKFHFDDLAGVDIDELHRLLTAGIDRDDAIRTLKLTIDTEAEHDPIFHGATPEPAGPAQEEPTKEEGKRGGGQSIQQLMKERQNILNEIRQLRQIRTPNDLPLYGTGGLWTNQINKVMKRVPNFLGTIASDQFSSLLSKIKPHSKVGWISNLDNSNQPGSHWVAFIVNGSSNGPDAHSILYFDPFGEDIPVNMLSGLKQVADKISPNTMLKLKVSRVQHQDKSTENCGYFAMNFIIDILSRNKSFSEATGYSDIINDKSGKYEQQIERLKKQPPFKYLDMVDDEQEGGKIRTQAPPKFRAFLEKHGHEHIQSIGVYRKPIMSIIQKAVDWIRKLTGREANEQYDKLFHLYIVFTLRESGTTWKMEKNQVLNIVRATQNDLTGENVESKSVAIPNMTIKQMFDKASGGRAEFFRYHPLTANCQIFIRDILRAGGVLTDTLHSFIVQDVKDLVPKFVSDIAQKATDVAHEVDVVLEGD